MITGWRGFAAVEEEDDGEGGFLMTWESLFSFSSGEGDGGYMIPTPELSLGSLFR